MRKKGTEEGRERKGGGDSGGRGAIDGGGRRGEGLDGGGGGPFHCKKKIGISSSPLEVFQ